MKEYDVHKIAFQYYYGYLEFLMMPFRLISYLLIDHELDFLRVVMEVYVDSI